LEKANLANVYSEEIKILKLNSKNISLLPIVYDKRYRKIWLNAYPEFAPKRLYHECDSLIPNEGVDPSRGDSES
jgi:hypothetical protein